MVMSLSFFQIMDNFEQFGSWDLDAWSVKLTFSIVVAFYLTKLKTELKNLKYSSHPIALSKGTIFDKKADFLQKKYWIQLN